MANEKRQRQKELRNSKTDEVERLARREVVRQRIILALLLVVLVGGALFLFTRDDTDDTVAAESELAGDTTTTIAAEEAVEQAEELVEQINEFTPPPSGSSITGETPCPEVDGSSERTTNFENPPPMCIDPAAAYTAVMETDMGTITIALDAARAPQTVNNFVTLARYGYYQDVPFHRIIPEFVIQGGDAVGGGNPPTLGAGNPGYAVPDELPEAGEYQVGSLAMANSGPDTNGSQFFIITGDNGVGLPPLYSLFGQVTEGLDVVEALNAIGTAGQGVPTEVVTIQSVTITEE